MRLPFLALLADGPAHGYELRGAVQERCGALLPPMNAGQVYNTLGRLESAGLVEGEAVAEEGRRDRRVYRITRAGRAELEAWVSRPVAATRFGDEFFFKLAFAGLAGLADPETLLEERRADCLQALRDTDAVARSGDRGSPAALLAERATVHLEAELRWLETCCERLAEGAA
jgi:DNA-binding PadR family transcriptional regulator